MPHYLRTFSYLIALLTPSSLLVANTPTQVKLSYQQGEVMQIIAPVSDPTKQALRDAYIKTNVGTAISYGYQNIALFRIDNTVVGEYSPEVLIFAKWPSTEQQTAFQALPLYAQAVTERKQAWEQLKLYDHQVQTPIDVSFQGDKSYTVAFAWTNPNAPNDYAQYMQSLPPMLNKVGARFLVTVYDTSLQTHQGNVSAPQQITIVEWDHRDGLQQLQALDEFQNIVPKLRSGTSKFELHYIAPIIN